MGTDLDASYTNRSHWTVRTLNRCSPLIFRITDPACGMDTFSTPLHPTATPAMIALTAHSMLYVVADRVTNYTFPREADRKALLRIATWSCHARPLGAYLLAGIWLRAVASPLREHPFHLWMHATIGRRAFDRWAFNASKD